MLSSSVDNAVAAWPCPGMRRRIHVILGGGYMLSSSVDNAVAAWPCPGMRRRIHVI